MGDPTPAVNPVTNSPQNASLKTRVQTLFNDMLASSTAAAKKKFNDNWTTQLSSILNEIDLSTSNSTNVTNQQLMDKLDCLEKKVAANHQQPSYADIAKSKPVISTIIIKPKNPNVDCIEVHKNLITTARADSSYRIITSSSNQRNIKIVSDSIKILDKVKDHIKKQKLEDDVEANALKKLDPQISFLVDPDQIEKVEMFKQRNRIPVEENVEIVNQIDVKTRKGYKLKRVIVRMSKKARGIIDGKPYVFIGTQSTPFKDDFHVRTCSKCFTIGHTASFCSNQPKCFKCPTNDNGHEAISCDRDNNHNGCLFCINSGISETDHVPKSDKCQSYMNTINRIKSITDWKYD